jgi:hypothetical protein
MAGIACYARAANGRIETKSAATAAVALTISRRRTFAPRRVRGMVAARASLREGEPDHFRLPPQSIRVLADIHLLIGRIVAEAFVQRIGLDRVVDPVAEGRDRRRVVGLDRLSGRDADR